MIELPADIGALRVALIGYGEVGGIFGAALAKAGVAAVTTFDVLVADAAWARQANARAARDGVALAASTAEAVSSAELIISAVTAGATAAAAERIAYACRRSAFVLDVNSASPYTKSAGAAAVERAGARYVEAAVMSSVPPHGIRVPMLLGGPHAQALQPRLTRLGFDAVVRSTTYGVVSAIKLCRSVFVKGMEALAIEGLLAARRYGVEDEVLKSLAETYPGLDWETAGDLVLAPRRAARADGPRRCARSPPPSPIPDSRRAWHRRVRRRAGMDRSVARRGCVRGCAGRGGLARAGRSRRARRRRLATRDGDGSIKARRPARCAGPHWARSWKLRRWGHWGQSCKVRRSIGRTLRL